MTDLIYGGPGIDIFYDAPGDDIIYAGGGNDYITSGRGADKLYGEAGDDTISVALQGGGRLIADGGSGNDSLYARNGGGPNQSVTFIGGDGNDTIGLDGFALDNIINAGRGNDTVFLGSTLGAIVALGDGADKLSLDSNFNPKPDSIIVNDYKPGTDQFDPNLGGNLYGWDGNNNPFSGGFVRLLASGKDTLLQFDPNGGGDAFVTALRFKNIAPNAFTAADFEGWPTDGSNPAGKTITGTDGFDTLKGTVGADLINGLGSSDTINGGPGSDRIYGGSGSDNIEGGGGDDIIYGGAGNDNITGDHGADKLYGEAGDDTISLTPLLGGRVIADGGSGNDSLSASVGSQSVTFIGGDGNDTISMNGFGTGNIINAGRGDDTVFLGSTLGAIVALGDGADKLALQSNFNPKPDSIIVNDYRPGTDQFDPDFERTLYGWDGDSNPFSGGFVRLVASGKDTLLQFDPNGGGDAFTTALRFKNIAPNAFTAADFGGWPIDGSSPTGKTITGTDSFDTLKGTIGADLIRGLGSSDTIDGGPGSDRIYGDSGSDSLEGGGGDDIIYGGAGNDNITGGRGADKLYGEAGDDTISIGLRGGGRLIADGGGGNDSLSASNGGGPNQSVTLIGGDGNDTISLNGFATDNIINAGRGNDTVYLGSTLGAIVALGDGADKLALQSNFGPQSDSIIVNDYKPGTDQFDPNFDGTLYGWDGTSNPFSGGFVRLVASGKDTLLQFDPDGGGDAFTTALRFKNIAPGAFTAADFGGWPTDGSSPAAKTIAGAPRHEADSHGPAHQPIHPAIDLFL